MNSVVGAYFRFSSTTYFCKNNLHFYFQPSESGPESPTFQEYILLENITSAYHYPCVLGNKDEIFLASF
jgi:hypothetical protein